MVHEVVDDVVCVFMPLGGEMEIDHGGLQTGMPQILLDAFDIDTGFQQMGGIAVPEGMDGDPLFDIELFDNPAQGSLNRTFDHRLFGRRGLVAATAGAGEYPYGVAVCCPEFTQHDQGGCRQRNVSVFSTLAAMHMDAPPLAVDITDLEVQGLIEPETAGVYHGHIGAVVVGADGIYDFPGFIDT